MIQIGWTRGKPSRRGDRPILSNTPNSSGLISGFCFFILLNLLSLFWASVTSPWLAVALAKAASLRTDFWPFTGVLRKIWRFVTRKAAKTTDEADTTDKSTLTNRRKRRRRRKHFGSSQTESLLSWLSSVRRKEIRRARRSRPTYPCYPLDRWPASPERARRRVKLFRLFLAESLERGIAAQRVPDRIESEKCWRNRR